MGGRGSGGDGFRQHISGGRKIVTKLPDGWVKSPASMDKIGTVTVSNGKSLFSGARETAVLITDRQAAMEGYRKYQNDKKKRSKR